jgi:altronate dehydratase
MGLPLPTNMDVAGIDNFFIDLADHPNVNSVLIVGLGCETIQGQELAAKLLARNESTKYQIIQESGGVEGTVAGGVKSAQELSAQFVPAHSEVPTLRIGIDIARDISFTDEFVKVLQDSGFETVISNSDSSSAQSFSHLAREKCHLIISFPDSLQPASGFPLIPVINVAGQSPLHQAIRADFDSDEDSLLASVVDLIRSVAAGSQTVAEKNKSGEIRAPRSVRSV